MITLKLIYPKTSNIRQIYYLTIKIKQLQIGIKAMLIMIICLRMGIRGILGRMWEAIMGMEAMAIKVVKVKIVSIIKKHKTAYNNILLS